MLAMEDRGVGQRVPGTACTELLLMFSEHFKTVGKEGSLAEPAWLRIPLSEVAGLAGSSTAQPGFKTYRQEGKSELFVLVADPQQGCQVSCWALCCQLSWILYKNEGDATKVQCKNAI